MKNKEWKKPECISLNSKETREPSLRHFPTAWHCTNCGAITATEDTAGVYKCDGCGKVLTHDEWVGDGPHPS